MAGTVDERNTTITKAEGVIYEGPRLVKRVRRGSGRVRPPAASLTKVPATPAARVPARGAPRRSVLGGRVSAPSADSAMAEGKGNEHPSGATRRHKHRRPNGTGWAGEPRRRTVGVEMWPAPRHHEMVEQTSHLFGSCCHGEMRSGRLNQSLGRLHEGGHDSRRARLDRL